MTESLGVLILHGFTATRATVAPLVPQVEAYGLPWRLPQLRGHWTSPSDLEGVSYEDMLADALAAFDDLRREAARVIILGLSVGGVIGLDLAMRRRADVAAIAVMVPALRYVSRLSPLGPVLVHLIKNFKGDVTAGFSDAALATQAGNYTSFPTATFLSIYRAGRQVEGRLGQVTAPALVLGARRDRVIKPEVSQIVFDRIASSQKRLEWFERSGHEMLLDCEAEAVAGRIGQFLGEVTGRPAAGQRAAESAAAAPRL